MRTIVVGVGNPILGDDGVGVHVVNELKKYVDSKDIKIEEAATGGLNLLDTIVGFERAIIVDAVEGNNVGEVKEIRIDEFSSVHSYNPHDISFKEAIELAEKLGENRIPKEIKIIGITIKNASNEFGEKLSEEVSKAIPRAISMILKEIKEV